jgi:hypothetical protein
MDINSKPGTKIKYANFNSGMPHDQDWAEKHLKHCGVYTVDQIEAHAFDSQVCLKEFPGVWFNTVLFSNDSIPGNKMSFRKLLVDMILVQGGRLRALKAQYPPFNTPESEIEKIGTEGADFILNLLDGQKDELFRILPELKNSSSKHAVQTFIDFLKE